MVPVRTGGDETHPAYTQMRLCPDLSIRILAVSYAGAVEGSKAAFHLGRGCGHEKRTVLPSNGLSRERAEHPEPAPNGFPGEAPPQNALEIFR